MTWFLKQQIDYTNSSKLKRDTGWISPGNVIQTSGDSATFFSFSEPKNTTNYTTMTTSYVDNLDFEPKPIWNNINNLKTTDSNYCSILSANANNTIKKYDTPNILCKDFDFSNIPSGATITGIKVKLVKSGYGDYNNNNTNFTDYTFDRVVTLGTDETSYKNKALTYIKEENNKNAIGTWTIDSEPYTYLYGDDNDLWYNDNSSEWTVDKIKSSDFGCLIGATQHISTGNTTQTFSTLSDKRNYYNNLCSSSNTNLSNIGVYVSKLYNIQIKVFYTIESDGYSLVNRYDSYTSGNTQKSDDVYFKYQQCLNGICYNYIKNINDIYDISLMTGDGNSINNMYNEYNIIDEYLPNLYQVDIATKEQIDLSTNHYNIDNVKLKPNHLVLLFDQQSAQTNDIYRVNNDYFLENSNLLSTREESYRAKVYVKLGTYNQQQYFLQNVGNQFPISGETKHFISGHSYIVKNRIDYNIFNLSTGITMDSSGNTTNPNKILFTDYSVARTLSETTDWNIDPIDISPTSFITLKYLDNEYTLNISNRILYQLTGNSAQTNITFESGNTVLKCYDNGFLLNSNTGESVQLMFNYDDESDTIPTDVILDYFSTIKKISTNTITIEGIIPNYILNEITKKDFFVIVRNLHYCAQNCNPFCSEYEKFLNFSPYGDILKFTDLGYNNLLRIETKEKNNSTLSDFYRYFDFDLLSIITDEPQPFMNKPMDRTICHGGTLSEIGFTSNSSATYSWTNNKPSINLPISGNGNIPSFVANNTTTGVTTALITVIPTFPSGIGLPKTFNILVNPLGQVNQPSDITTYNGQNISDIIFTTTTPNTIFEWKNENNANIGMSYNNGIGNISAFTATNNITYPITANMSVTPRFDSCYGLQKTFNIIVNPIAQVNQIRNKTYCNGVTVHIPFTTVNTIGITTFNWTCSDDIGAGYSGVGDMMFSAYSPFITENVTVEVTPVFTYNGNSNTGDTMSFIITVNDIKTPIFSSISSSYYSGNSVPTLNNISDNGISGTWNPTSINNLVSGTYIFTPDAGVCANIVTKNITILPKSIPIFSFATEYCNNTILPITLPTTSDNSYVGVWIPSTITKSDIYTFIPNDTSVSSITKQITILEKPQVNVSDVVCCNNSIKTISFTTNYHSGITTYSWTNSNTATGIATNGSGDITFTTTNSTTNIISSIITVTPTLTYNSVVCIGTPVTFKVEIVPTPQVNNISNQTLLVDEYTTAITFTTTNTVSTIYQWTKTQSPTSSISIGCLNSGVGNIPSFKAKNTNNDDVVATFTTTPVIAYKSVTCTGTPKTFNITVNPYYLEMTFRTSSNLSTLMGLGVIEWNNIFGINDNTISPNGVADNYINRISIIDSNTIRLYGCSKLKVNNKLKYNTINISTQEIVSIKGNIITNLGIGIFVLNNSLTTINLKNLLTIGNGCFSNCQHLVNTYLPDVLNIGSASFSQCGLLNSISLPSATYIADFSFDRCYKLSTVYLPSVLNLGGSVTDDGVFNIITGVTSLTVPVALKTCNVGNTPDGDIEQLSINCAGNLNITYIGISGYAPGGNFIPGGDILPDGGGILIGGGII